MGGGGGGAGGSGNGAGDGDGGVGGGGDGSGSDASGDQKNGGCAAGDPVCPITGRVVLELFDFGFGGLLPLRWVRRYSSRTSHLAGELGHGWSHSYGWRLRQRRDTVEVIDDWARVQTFAMRPDDAESSNAIGMRLVRLPTGFLLVHGTEALRLTFGPEGRDGWSYVTRIEDACGNGVTIDRDERGVLRGLIDAAGRAYRVATDPSGRIREVFVATGPLDPATGRSPGWMRTIRYDYDDAGDLIEATDAEDFRWGYVYDHHLMVEHRAASGLSIFYRYDGSTRDARCVESWGEYRDGPDPALLAPPPPRPPSGQPDRRKVKGILHVRLTYDSATRYAEVENALGGVTRYFGDAVGRATKIVYPDGSAEERHFDPVTGGLVGVSERGGVERTIVTDGTGSAIGFDESLGEGTERRYLPNRTTHDRHKKTGAIVERQYDERGLLVFEKHPDGTTDEYAYDDRGALERHVDRMGVVTRTTHDAAGNCTRIDRPGVVLTNEYDYLGRRTAHVDALGRRTEFRNDRRSEVVYKRLPDGGEVFVERNADRRITLLRDVDQTTRFEYGGFAWLFRRTAHDGCVTEYRYDLEGHLIWVKNPRGQIFEQEVDRARRSVRWRTFEGQEIRSGFSGPLQSWLRTADGRVVLEHDEAGRLLKMETTTGDLELEHGPFGLTKLDNGVIKLETEHDAMGRVVVDKQGPYESRVGWKGGKIAQIVSSAGLPIRYEYNVAGMLRGVLVGSHRVLLGHPHGGEGFTYFDDDVVIRERLTEANALKEQSVTRYDVNVPIEQCGRTNDPHVLFSRRYQHDVTQRHPVSEWRGDGTTIEWELDASKRITAQRTSKGGLVEREETLRYDAAGTVRVDQAGFDADARPVSYFGETFAYDSKGRLVKRVTDRGVFHYTWNALDQLIHVRTPDREVVMDYDAKGRRMRKAIRRQNEVVSRTAFIWSGDTLLHEVDELSGNTRTYVRGPKAWQPVGHVDVVGGVERLVAYVQDRSGKVDLAVDSSGTIVWSADYTAFGHATIREREVDVTVRFANQFWDEDVELTYNRHRWYDARLGLYVTTDPMLMEGTFNPRDYSVNPLVYWDPLGLAPHPGPGSGQDTDDYHPSPAANPSGVARPSSVDDMNSHYMSGPGHWARPDIPPPGSERRPAGYAECPDDALHSGSGFGSGSGSVQAIVDRAGDAYGCHGCGARDSGWGEGEDGHQHWTCDHVPPRTTFGSTTANRTGNHANHNAASSSNVRLYPHCMSCSQRQGGLMSHMPDASRLSRGSALLANPLAP